MKERWRGEFSSDPKTVKPVSVFLEKGGVEINCTVCHLSSLSVERLQKEGKETFTCLHLADAFIQSDSQSIDLYCQYVLNPQPFALLTQCFTTEPQEHGKRQMN